MTKRGLHLGHPDTGRVTELDEWGDQVESSAQKLGSKIQMRSPVCFQWWLYDSVDIFCGIQNLPSGLLLHDYGFIGLSQEEISKAVSILLDLFRVFVQAGTARGLIADAWGFSENFDWTNLFEGEDYTLPDYWPEVLGLRVDLAKRLDPHLASYKIEEIEGFRIYSRPITGSRDLE